MKTSRQRLLEYLSSHHPLSATEISQALRMTEANARHHLSILKSQGSVDVVARRALPGKGRPILLYGPSIQTQGNNLDHLAAALLGQLLDGLSNEAQLDALQKIASRMLVSLPSQSGSHLTQRLYNAVQQLNAWHYQSRWEAHREAPRLILGHCPYAAILPIHPACCTLDMHLLAGLLGAPVEQIVRLAQDSRGLPQCVFRVQNARR